MSNINDEDNPHALALLIAKAGQRTQPPSETRDAVYMSTLLAWQESLRKRRQRRLQFLALAASMATAALCLTWYAAGNWRATTLVAARQFGSGAEIRVGETIKVRTTPGLIVNTAAGDRLRFAADSEFGFLAAQRLKLLSGKVYVEAATADPSVASLLIETRFGSVRHQGTRYAVSISGNRMAVSVRDGRVRVATRTNPAQLRGGMQVVLNAEGEEISRNRVATYGPVWAWTETLAPSLQIDGRRLADVLQDIAFETGRSLEFASDEVRRACAQIELKGPFLDLPASDRLFAVLVTTGFEAIESGERIVIRELSQARTSRSVTN